MNVKFKLIFVIVQKIFSCENSVKMFQFSDFYDNA